MTEEILWIYLPAAVGPLAAVISMACFRWRRSSGNLAAFVVILSLVCFTELLFFGMLLGAWPTFIPHVLIGTSLLLALAQFTLNRRRPLPRD